MFGVDVSVGVSVEGVLFGLGLGTCERLYVVAIVHGNFMNRRQGDVRRRGAKGRRGGGES